MTTIYKDGGHEDEELSWRLVNSGIEKENY